MASHRHGVVSRPFDRRSIRSSDISGLSPALDIYAAFESVDAICRKFLHPTGRQLFLRALCLLAIGDLEAYRRELRNALDADASDLDILKACLDLDPALARSVVFHPSSGDELARRAACAVVKAEPLVLWAERTPSGLRAVVACASGARPSLWIDDTPILLDQGARGGGGEVDLFEVRHEVKPTASTRLKAELGPHAAAMVLPPARMACERPFVIGDVVSVVVPVYGGREATRLCLAALADQRCSRTLDVVIVDDACPDAGMIAEVSRFAADRGWRLIRNPVNLGFAATVNTGARAAVGADILLLNADAILPAGAVDRLLRAVSEPGVGTAVPFSNDGGFTGFPVMRVASPVLDAEEAERTDAAARCSGVRHAIDIPAGTAFCMMVTGQCWAAVGGLDLGYGRGYFEDVDLCLRAKRMGFRNVLAPDLYVRHLGGQSFGAAKRALAADNARLLVERFPEYDAEWMPFVEADPLEPLREGIERRIPPRGPVVLIAGQGSAALTGASGSIGGARRLHLREDRGGARLLRASDGGVPQSLRFEAGEIDALRTYLRSVEIVETVFVDPSDALLRDLEALPFAERPVALALTGPSALRRHRSRSGLLARAAVQACDRMGRAALGLRVDPLPAPKASGGGPVRVAALMPRATVAADRLLFTLDRRLKPHGGEIVIFGRGIAGRARPSATGVMEGADYPAALVHRKITHVLLPDVDTPFALIEDLRRSSPLPAAYVDWSLGRHRAASGDLALAESADDLERVSALLAWCLAETRIDRPLS